MAFQEKLPEYVQRIAKEEKFRFACHKGVSCFTECCRMLELALTPYDALRLRHGAAKNSKELLDNYLIVEQDPGEPFPRVYLTMIDDGRASCVFVSTNGCTIYEHRPSACRTYPMGRAVMRQSNNSLQEHFVLMREQHCQGFAEEHEQTPDSYTKDQGLLDYNRFNDEISAILQHDSIRKGFIPSKKQVDFFILALYDLDTFRDKIKSNQLPAITIDAEVQKALDKDESLLKFAINWLHGQLYSAFPTKR